MIKDINQSLYDTLFNSLSQFCSVYDSNPNLDEPYPFIQLGTIQIIPRVTKSHWIAIADVTIDVWGYKTDRSLVSSIANQIIVAGNQLKYLQTGHDVYFMPHNSTIEMVVDQSTATDLWRGIVRLQFEVN